MKTFVNMLPQYFRKRNLVRTRLVHWVPVWLLVFATAAPLCWTKYSRYEADTAAMRTKERRHSAVELLNAELATIRRQLTGLQEHEDLAAELVNNQPLLSLVGIVSRSAQQCSGKLRVDSFSMARGVASAPRASQQQNSTSGATRQLVLEGQSLDNLAVPKFVALLRQAGIFERVELKSSKAGNSVADGIHSYRVECTL